MNSRIKSLLLSCVVLFFVGTVFLLVANDSNQELFYLGFALLMASVVCCVVAVIMNGKVSQNNETFYAVKQQDTNTGCMLKESEFWKVISYIDIENYDVDKATEFLKNQEVSFIERFEETLSYKLYLLDTEQHAIASGLMDEEYFSVDMFLYVRCFVVANGESFYNACLTNSENMPQDQDDFELILYLAFDAYKLRTNKDFEYSPRYNKETFSNKTAWQTSRNQIQSTLLAEDCGERQ